MPRYKAKERIVIFATALVRSRILWRSSTRGAVPFKASLGSSLVIKVTTLSIKDFPIHDGPPGRVSASTALNGI